MDCIYAKHLLSPLYTIFPTRPESVNITSEGFHGVSLIPRRSNMKLGHSLLIPRSKRSIFQDFQGFVKPLRLLPATDANKYRDYIPEAIFSTAMLERSKVFYIMELITSKDFGSCLKDLNAAILLCLIDVDGDSIMQRISAVSSKNHGSGTGTLSSESIHFQRGSVDLITFKGSKLGKIEALWIGLESGSWRLDGVRMTIIHGPPSFSKSIIGKKEGQSDGLLYEFEADNILLGEGGESVAELRPVLVSELGGNNLPASSNSNMASGSSPSNLISNEEGMREYEDLKFSLLLYDFVLVLSGSTILTLSYCERSAISFSVGGFSGFLYLLLLQRSVDELSPASSPSTALGGLKGLLLGMALALATSVILLNFGVDGPSLALTPMEIFIGIVGFLTYKLAVVLAALKPIKRSLKDLE